MKIFQKQQKCLKRRLRTEFRVLHAQNFARNRQIIGGRVQQYEANIWSGAAPPLNSLLPPHEKFGFERRDRSNPDILKARNTSPNRCKERYIFADVPSIHLCVQAKKMTNSDSRGNLKILEISIQ